MGVPPALEGVRFIRRAGRPGSTAGETPAATLPCASSGFSNTLGNSSTESQRDRIEKKALYEQADVAEYWITDPDAEAIEVFALIKGVYQLHSKATGKEPAKSKLLAGFKTTFTELKA